MSVNTTPTRTSTIQNLRDLNYFGSDSPKWKSAYKKDFRFYQHNELSQVEPHGLRKAAEVIIKDENVPLARTENRTSFPGHSVPARNENVAPHSKSYESNPKIFHEDDRLVNFTTTSNDGYPAFKIASREPVDKIAMLEQIKSFSLADRPVEKMIPKSAIEFPERRCEAGKTRFVPRPPCEIERTLKEQPSIRFDGNSTVAETYPAYSSREYLDAKGNPVLPNYTPIASLFPLTNEPTGNSRSRADHQPFTPKQMLTARSDSVKQLQHRDPSQLFHKDDRLTDISITSHEEHRSFRNADCHVFDKNGTMDYKHKYGDVVGNDLKMEEKFIPKHLHQQSMTSDCFPLWSEEAYRRPKRNFGSFISSLPPGIESDPPVMTTEHRESMVPHPAADTQSFSPPPSQIVTAIPLGAPMHTKESEFRERYKHWDLPDKNKPQMNMQTTSIMEPKHGLDYQTTNQISYPAFAASRVAPVIPDRDRNTILNDANTWRRISPFFPNPNSASI